MRLGFDLDDVVTDLVTKVEEYVAVIYGIEWMAGCHLYYDFDKCAFCSDKELNQKIVEDLKDTVRFDPELYLSVKPIKGAREVLQKFKRNGHEIHFISGRATQLQPATFKWLRENEIPFDNLILTGGKDEQKGGFGRKYNLDMFVDDIVFHLESMLWYKKRWRKGLLLFDKPWNDLGHDASKFIRVYNWRDILRHVGIANR